MGMERWYPESVVTDEGVGLRRAGVAVMCLGGLLALAGLTTVTLAYETWSGYVPQAAIAMAVGAAAMGIGWTLLRAGDRHGPRLQVLAPRPARREPSVAVRWTHDRVRVENLPLAALPRARS
jgi:hypothetical protein